VVKESIITENKVGGFLLDNSRVNIEQNNILNNGGWGMKVISDNGNVEAPNNWWGNEKPDPSEIIGPVNIKPILSQPIDLRVHI
jgi:hypothetical protein